MTKRIFCFCCLIAAWRCMAGENAGSQPQFQEVYNLLRTNLSGASPPDLDRAAIKGLLEQFPSRVLLVSALSTNWQAASVAALGKTAVYEGSYAYVRIASVGDSLAGELMAAYRDLGKTNKSNFKGIILDLRFAGGSSYSAAGKTADCFLNAQMPLLDWGSGAARATLKEDAISLPLAVLVNSQTAEAAEALAAALREGKAGLLIGTKTAGQANIFKEFPLANGDKLRVAVSPVKLGDGTAFASGLEPDITLHTTATEDRAYMDDPYGFSSLRRPAASANLSAEASRLAANNHRRYNEVELIREHREGADLEQDWEQPLALEEEKAGPKDEPPVIRDPALVRGLDLLKGLAVVRGGRPG